MQPNTRTPNNHPNKSTSTQANRTTSVQTRGGSSPVNRTILNQKEEVSSQSSTVNNNAVTCRKCKSQQVVGNRRGYRFSKMFAVLGVMIGMIVILIAFSIIFSDLLVYKTSSGKYNDTPIAILGLFTILLGIISLPVSVLCGFIGRNEIVNGCMNCGFKWRPSKMK